MENSVKLVACHTKGVTSSRKIYHPEHVKRDLTTRLNRIEGQTRGIKGMIDKGVYCDDMIT
jgi:CsoR family transcriptional regulator, copper-sensing transcriptional repressor